MPRIGRDGQSSILIVQGRDMSLVSRIASLLGRPLAIEQEKPDDFVAVGYPKTGNTWARVMLGKYIQLAYDLPFMPLFDPGEKGELERAGYQGPFGTFTHAPLVWTGQTASDLTYDNVVAPFRKQMVILIIRHPLDVLVSAFMHNLYQATVSRYPGSIEQFIEDPVFGLDKLLRFYQLWATYCDKVRGFLIWRYEDARAQASEHLLSLLKFLGLQPRELLIKRAVEFASFENMQRLERSGEPPRYKSSGFAIFATGSRDNLNAYHVRKGKIRGYRDEISEEFAKRMEIRIATEMPACFGYSQL